MRKIVIIGAGIVLLIVIALIFSQVFSSRLSETFKETPSATINKQTFTLELAKSGKDQEIGLSKYNNLDQNKGMLFIFQKPGFYPFWMKKMKFPIDIIYVNKDKIVEIFSDVKPPKSQDQNPPVYQSSQPADKVLEINSGLSKKFNFKKGDTVTYDNLGN